MSFSKTISQNPVASFTIGTLAIQLCVLLSCLVLRSVYLSRTTSGVVASTTVDSTSTESSNSPSSIVERKDDIPASSNSLIESGPAAVQQAPEALAVPDVQAKSVVHVVKSGDTLTKIWTAYGGTVSGAILAGKALERSGITGTALRQGERITLTISAEGDVVQLKRKLKDGRALIIEGDSRKGYRVSTSEAAITERERVASGSITRSFAQAAEDQDIPYVVINELVDIFGGQIEFSRQVRSGDSFSVIYSERMTVDGEPLESTTVRAASFRVNGKSYAAVRFVAQDGSVRYFDEDGQPLGNFFLRYPLQFTRISSVFSTARFHPILGVNRPHNGVDFAAPLGTPIRAVADGVVSTAGYIGEAGNMIKIQHGDRYATAYLHLSRIARGLHSGSRVRRGDIIGAVGMSGLASGPHLHFSFYDRGVYVNPLEIKLPRMPQSGEIIPVGYLRATLKLLSDQHERVQVAALSDVASPKV